MLKYDQSIPGLKNEDSKDLTREAKITASSSLTDKGETPDNPVLRKSMSVSAHDQSVLIPIKDSEKLSTIKLYLKSRNKQTTMVDVSVEGVKKMGKPGHELKLGQYNLEIAPYAQKWMKIPLSNTIPENIDFLRVEVPAAEGILWPSVSWIVQETNPVIEPVNYMPDNIINGWTRLKENKESLWVSDPSDPFPQWIELDLDNPSELNTVHLTFDTDPSTGRPEKSLQEVCVKSYEVSAFSNGEWIALAEIEDNIQRHRVHRFKGLRADKLRLTIRATQGAPSARVFEIRAYNE